MVSVLVCIGVLMFWCCKVVGVFCFRLWWCYVFVLLLCMGGV